ncbi:MAG: Fatty-acid desaturase [Parcubacteria group bacterium GW2011_GWD2_43_10]|uniref:Fatty acid desaturase domain-containing protein n=1 Tax=Candidatus Veblenbacteria bacterium RIFOXYD1_FULL_43_11 TaxID=1802429 RepID=A0A1G2Q7L1_9BACT|nr:MAG: Fatty-acid desaturase [Parcubacteria group bacterium GW2011_GWD2_43_10]KKS92172.1 MAG: Fatty-acid desaturase [Parcubacteria group bacterium GW2011_GWE2_43_12]KKT21151.1 MAG: Fatty-acid desaturase [Parcubacteria group bacterium GW2011_GWE1_43_8]OHA56109.1 MAG: hypothetical protein A2588_01025 [Candidatus Veblenbacteria bacterium RIFOXYD1_FULL_43_11]HAO81412.1 hypothetical protein [Candidatus Veblenbacteria bacterium]
METILGAGSALLFILAALYFQGVLINISTTLYLHRAMTHRAVDFNWVIQFFMRFVIWLWNGILVKGWTGVHIVHHAHTDLPGDPHSPHQHGVICAPDLVGHLPITWWEKIMLRVLKVCPYGFGITIKNYAYYLKAARLPKIIEQGRAPRDWLERYWFSRARYLGPFVLLPLSQVALAWCLFGPWGILLGLLLWALLLLWTVLSGGIVNGLGHSADERDAQTRDYSRNLPYWLNWIVIGEQNHHDHHRYSGHWWFGQHDFGANIIKLCLKLKLAKVKVMPT